MHPQLPNQAHRFSGPGVKGPSFYMKSMTEVTLDPLAFLIPLLRQPGCLYNALTILWNTLCSCVTF